MVNVGGNRPRIDDAIARAVPAQTFVESFVEEVFAAVGGGAVAEFFEIVDERVSGVEITAPKRLRNAVLGKASGCKRRIDALCAVFDEAIEIRHDCLISDAGVEHIVPDAFHDGDDDVFSRRVAHVVGQSHRFDSPARGGGNVGDSEIAQKGVLIDAVVGDIDGVRMDIGVERRRIGGQIECAAAVAIDIGGESDERSDRGSHERFVGQEFARIGKSRRQNAHKQERSGDSGGRRGNCGRFGDFGCGRVILRFENGFEDERAHGAQRGDRQDGDENDVAVPAQSLPDHVQDAADARRKLEKTECAPQKSADFMPDGEVERDNDDPRSRAYALHFGRDNFEKFSDACKRYRPQTAKGGAQKRQNGDKARNFGRVRVLDRRKPARAAENGQAQLQADGLDDKRKNPQNDEEFVHECSGYCAARGGGGAIRLRGAAESAALAAAMPSAGIRCGCRAISPFGLNTLRLPRYFALRAQYAAAAALFRPSGSIRCGCRAISPFGLNTLRLPRYFALRAQYAAAAALFRPSGSIRAAFLFGLTVQFRSDALFDVFVGIIENVFENRQDVAERLTDAAARHFPYESDRIAREIPRIGLRGMPGVSEFFHRHGKRAQIAQNARLDERREVGKREPHDF